MAESATPLVDVVIPVHNANRPLERAIGSVLGGAASISVVCHNVAVEEVRSRLSPSAKSGVDFLEFNDGVGSPAGPKNFGMRQTRAKYLVFLDSDDLLEPNAVEAWTRVAERANLAAVIAPERQMSGARVRTPPVRPTRRQTRDAVRDRLAYRSAPLGLLRRSSLERLGIAFEEGFPTGEDLSFTARLWFSGERIGYARHAPAYVVGGDAGDRVTVVRRPILDELAPLGALFGSDWFLSLALRQRRALAIKAVRVHLFGAALSRSQDGIWTDEDRDCVCAFLARLDAIAPAFERPLSIVDRRLLDALRGSASPAAIARLAVERRRFARPAALVSRDPRGQFATEGPFRFMLSSALL